MHLTLAPVALLLSLATAQTFSMGSTSSSACAALPVLESCIASTQAIAQGCASTDYNCLCQKWTDVQICFLQCPSDSRGAAVDASKATYCNDALAYPSPTSSAISRAVSSAVSAATTGSSTAAGITGAEAAASNTASGSAASAAASTTSKNAAGRERVSGGVVVGLMGLLGALL